MNRHLVIKMSRFYVVKLRNSPAITRISRLKSEHFNHKMSIHDLFRDSLNQMFTPVNIYGSHYLRTKKTHA